MDYEITAAKTADDLAEVADLMAKVFASRSYFDFYKGRSDYQNKDPYYKPEFSRIIRVGGAIVSHVSIIEKHLRIGDSVVKVAGIGDVCTHPAHRGKGYTNILMNDSLAYMAAHRFPLTMLYGIMNFYHKFGYIEAANFYKTTVPVRNLASLPAAAALRPFKDTDLKKLDALYNRAFAGKTLSARRVPAVWYNAASPKTCFVLPDKKDNPVGYLLTSAPPAAPSLGFWIREAIGFDASAFAALAAFARDRARDLSLPEIEIHMRPDNPFVHYLCDFGATQTTRVYAEGEGQAMLRLVLLKEFFEDIREELTRRLQGVSATAGLEGVEVAFKTDIGQVSLRAGKKGVEIADKPAKGATTIKTPQNALTRLVIGHWGVESFLRRIGKESLGDKPRALLTTLFPAGTPYLNEADYF